MSTMRVHRLVYAALVAAMFAVIIVAARAADPKLDIDESFRASYNYRTYLKDDSIKLADDNGVITLTGTVAEESHKSLASHTLENIVGVVRVDNQLLTKEEVATDDADAWISKKVKLVLMYRRHVSYSDTFVNVEDGVVTLSGNANSASQKTLTGEYAADVDGVKSVTNNMTVVENPVKETRTEGQKIDDASVTAMVNMTLAGHNSTSALKTKVVARDGEVTVTGIAKNATQKTLVTKLIDDVQGVTSVNNEMTIDEIKTQ